MDHTKTIYSNYFDQRNEDDFVRSYSKRIVERLEKNHLWYFADKGEAIDVSFIKATRLMKDRQTNISFIVVHSDVFYKLKLEGRGLDYLPTRDGKVIMPYYKGFYVICDDRVPMVKYNGISYHVNLICEENAFVNSLESDNWCALVTEK